jgi:hypothetical protein
MAARVGFSATINRQSRQVRKEATVTVISGAGEVLARAVSIHPGILAAVVAGGHDRPQIGTRLV